MKVMLKGKRVMMLKSINELSPKVRFKLQLQLKANESKR